MPRRAPKACARRSSILNGEKVEKTITLDTMKVTKDNAAEILKQNGL